MKLKLLLGFFILVLAIIVLKNFQSNFTPKPDCPDKVEGSCISSDGKNINHRVTCSTNCGGAYKWKTK